MAIPLATTTITVARVPADPDRDPADEQPAAETVTAGVRAHLSGITGNENFPTQEVITRKLACDPTDLEHGDTITDDTTGAVYTVVYAEPRVGLNLDHVEAGLKKVEGYA